MPISSRWTITLRHKLVTAVIVDGGVEGDNDTLWAVGALFVTLMASLSYPTSSVLFVRSRWGPHQSGAIRQRCGGGRGPFREHHESETVVCLLDARSRAVS